MTSDCICLSRDIVCEVWSVCVWLVFRIKMYEHENQWSKVVGSYDLQMGISPSTSTQVGLIKVEILLHSLHAYNNDLFSSAVCFKNSVI